MSNIEKLSKKIKDNFKNLDQLAGIAENAGTASFELVELLKYLEVGMVKAPKLIGGYELSLADQLRFFEELSYANATAGWVGFNHAGVAASCGSRLTDRGVEEIFGGNQQLLLSGIINPTGYYKEVDGGMCLNGTYPYASGIRHADYIMLPAKNQSSPDVIRKFVVKPNQIQIIGDWNVMSLKGTGSFTVQVQECFIPKHLCLESEVQRGGKMYNIGLKAFVASELLGFTLGVCQRFLDELKKIACKKIVRDQGLLSERGAFLFEIGKGELEIEANRSFGYLTLMKADELCQKNNLLTPEEELKISAMLSYGVDQSVQVVSRLFQFAGASALFNNQILERCFRDAHAARQHHNTSNYAYELYGRQLLSRL